MKALEKFAMVKVSGFNSIPRGMAGIVKKTPTKPFLQQEAGLGSKLVGGGVLSGIGYTAAHAAG